MDIKPALLYLRDTKCFDGVSYGYPNNVVGEVVFNTSMTGYQEIITDPSYAKQIITFSYPHIGNTGINDEDNESNKIHASGVVIRNPITAYSNYRGNKSLTRWLAEKQISAISNIDTRALIHHIRDNGSQDAAIVHYLPNMREQAIKQAQELLNSFPGLKGNDIAKTVSVSKPYEWMLTNGQTASSKYHVVVYDFGVKTNILRLLASNSCKVTIVPAKTPVEEVLAYKPDGVLLSNGPGDPEPCDYAIKSIQVLLEQKMPMLGICLGHQLLALALGGKTKKMKFGHHGANHPVEDYETNKVFITSQNHGFEVEESSIASITKVTHRSLFDNSLQGFITNNKLAMGFQGHPEASPGPQEISPIFQEFISMIEYAKTH